MIGRWRLEGCDLREPKTLRAFRPNTFDAVLTDAPYGLAGARTRTWDELERGRGRGFMGQAWDAAVPGVAFWSEVRRVLKPGGPVVSFFGTRTYHRGVVAMEDAGLEIRDTIAWLFGSGFPKNPAVLKPGHEPAVLARKPLEGTLAANVARWGVGELAIDACRVGWMGAPSGWSSSGSKASANVAMSGRNYARDPKPDASGRWPANVLLDEAAAAALDEQSGERRSALTGRADPSVSHAHVSDPKRRRASMFGNETARGRLYADSGGASRFFYCPKASRSERDRGLTRTNDHPTVKPIALTRYLATLLLPPRRGRRARRILVPFAGSGSEMLGALLAGWEDVTGLELEARYRAIARRRLLALERNPTEKTA